PAEALRRLELDDNRLHGRALVAGLRSLPRLTNLQALSLRNCGLNAAAIASLAEVTQLAKLTELDLGDNSLGDEGTQALVAACQSWPQLQVLRLQNLSRAAAGTICAATQLHGLRSLQLSGHDIGDAAVQILARASHLAGLTSLALSCSTLTSVAAAQLVGLTHFANLRNLHPTDRDVFAPWEHLPDNRGVLALQKATHLSRLQALSFSSGTLDDQGLAVLASLRHLSEVTSLILANGRFGLAGAKTLADAPWLASLRRLNLGGAQLPADAAAALLGSPYLAGLQDVRMCTGERLTCAALAMATQLTALSSLHLCCGPHCDAEALAYAPHLHTVRQLTLSAVGLSDADLAELMRTDVVGNLLYLNLKSNALTSRGIHFLAKARHVKHLTYLNLYDNKIGDAGVQALARAPQLSSLRCLKVSGYKPRYTWEDPSLWIDAASIEALSFSPFFRGLTKLSLRGTNADDEALRSLTNARGLYGLRDLDLRSTTFSNVGLGHLARADNLHLLRRLRISGWGGPSPIGPAGVLALAQTTNMDRLTSLSLCGAQLSDQSALALLDAKGLHKLVYLSYVEDGLSDQVVRRMKGRFSWIEYRL
ncbi:MAG: hypothetical protein EOO40_02230, partial [Deltaproteobacteria bacterium]